MRAYVDTRHTLQVRTAEVHALSTRKRQLDERLAEIRSGGTLVRGARRLGLVKPGEHLFIVKGIPVAPVARQVALARATRGYDRRMDDAAVVSRQLGRAPRAFRRVVVRCPFGRPAVTEQEPYDADGEPFPTTYYLTCPHLVAAVSRLEAAGGVERWSRGGRPT